MDTTPLLCTLPPGRHGLPREFVEENQRRRILDGLAHAICAKGYLAASIGDIVKSARTSRRTFYELFENKEAAAKALVEYGSGYMGPALNTGLGVLTVELVAMSVAGQPVKAVAAATRARALISAISGELEEVAS
jgi:AcrR family transcriptional regulator